MRSFWALLVLLWIALTCANLPPDEDAALAPPRAVLAGASEAALASLAPDAARPAAPVSFPVAAGPALRALRATGRGEDVAALEAAVDRAARLALADARTQIERAVASFDPEHRDDPRGDALAAAFRTAFEPELRAALEPAAARRLAEAGAPEALEGVRNAARSLPLPREVSLDLVSIVTERAAASFFNALADEARRLREERVAQESRSDGRTP